MEIQVGNLNHSLTDLSTVKKHQYDKLRDKCHTATRNGHTEVEWLGNTYTLQYANHLIEYLDPKFKDIL